MLRYTIKNFLYYLSMYCKDNDYTVEFQGARSKRIYSFKVCKGTVYQIIENSEIKIDDIFALKLKDNFFKPHLWKEVIFKKNRSVLKETILYPDYPAQIYIELFKVIGERAYFTFKVGSKYIESYYVDGKVLFLEEDDNTIYLRGSNLFNLQTTHPGYQILYISNSLDRCAYVDYVKSVERLASKKGKEFIKFRYDN